MNFSNCILTDNYSIRTQPNSSAENEQDYCKNHENQILVLSLTNLYSYGIIIKIL